MIRRSRRWLSQSTLLFLRDLDARAALRRWEANKARSRSGAKENRLGLADNLVDRLNMAGTRALAVLQPGDAPITRGGEYALRTDRPAITTSVTFARRACARGQPIPPTPL